MNKFQEACCLISVELPDVSVPLSHVVWRPWDVAGALVLVGVNQDILKKNHSFLMRCDKRDVLGVILLSHPQESAGILTPIYMDQ